MIEYEEDKSLYYPSYSENCIINVATIFLKKKNYILKIQIGSEIQESLVWENVDIGMHSSIVRNGYISYPVESFDFIFT